MSILALAGLDATFQMEIAFQQCLLPDPASILVWTECAKIGASATVRLGWNVVVQVVQDRKRTRLEDRCVPRLFDYPASIVIMEMANVRGDKMQESLVCVSTWTWLRLDCIVPSTCIGVRNWLPWEKTMNPLPGEGPGESASECPIRTWGRLGTEQVSGTEDSSCSKSAWMILSTRTTKPYDLSTSTSFLWKLGHLTDEWLATASECKRLLELISVLKKQVGILQDSILEVM